MHAALLPHRGDGRGDGGCHWFAGLPSPRMAQVAKSSNVVQNVLAIEADKTPIYDRILYVRTDEP